MSFMPITDSMFLLMESREHPMHVGGLQLFHRPADAGPDFLNEVYAELVETERLGSLFRRRPRGPVSSLGQWSWTNDDNIDLEYHVRLSALPRPGRIRELLALTSRLHGSLLDRHRPLWEMHLIEGLADDRFAIYTKVHHALLDGVAALRLLQRSLSENPNEMEMPAPFGLCAPKARDSSKVPAMGPGFGDILRRTAGTGVRLLGEIAGMGPAIAGSTVEAIRDHAPTLSFKAPRSMLNVPITGARRFAAQSWELSRIAAVRAHTGATLNDVVMAMCAGALRRYLVEQHALPDASLIAMVPVSLRLRGEVSPAAGEHAGGNAIGTVLCDLATDSDDPAVRLARVQTSMSRGKRSLAEMSQLQILAMSALTVAPLALGPIPGVVDRLRPPFNVIISNVPGPKTPMYWNGARLDGIYPVSLVLDGQALNITVTTYHDHLEFGLIGCRRSIPHLQRMLTHLETSLAELELIGK